MAWELGWQEQSPQRTQSCDMGPWTPGLQSRGQSFVSSPLVVVGTGTPAFLQATPLLASRGYLSLSPPQRRVPPALSTEHRAVTTPACLPCQQFRHLPSSPHLFPTVSPRGGGSCCSAQDGSRSHSLLCMRRPQLAFLSWVLCDQRHAAGRCPLAPPLPWTSRRGNHKPATPWPKQTLLHLLPPHLARLHCGKAPARHLGIVTISVEQLSVSSSQGAHSEQVHYK